MEVENTNLEPVRGILLHGSSLSLPLWLGESGWKRTLSTDSNVPRFPHFWPSHVAQYHGPSGLELFGLHSWKQIKYKCRVHNWFWNQFSVLFLVIGYRKCPTQSVFSQVWCWVCGGKRHTQGLPRVSPRVPLSHSSCLGRKSSLNGKTQWFFVCNTTKLSQLPQSSPTNTAVTLVGWVCTVTTATQGDIKKKPQRMSICVLFYFEHRFHVMFCSVSIQLLKYSGRAVLSGMLSLILCQAVGQLKRWPKGCCQTLLSQEIHSVNDIEQNKIWLWFTSFKYILVLIPFLCGSRWSFAILLPK